MATAPLTFLKLRGQFLHNRTNANPSLDRTSFSQVAFDKLTVDNAHQQANAAATAADQQAGFDIRMAKAEHDAGGMKASFTVTLMSTLHDWPRFFSPIVPILAPRINLRLHSIS